MASFVPHTGLFKHPFVFKVVDKTQNPSAGHEEAFRELCSARGYFRKKAGKSALEEGAYIHVSIYEAFCQYRSVLENNLTLDTRLFYDNKEFKIVDYEILNESRRFYRFELIAANQ